MSTEEEQIKVKKKASAFYMYYVSFVAAVGGFLFGYDLAVIAGAHIFLKEYFNLTPWWLGFAASSAILGCIAGPTLGAFLCDRLGRKTVLFVSALILMVSAIWTAIPNSITVFIIFRIVGGIGVGFASLASPMYIAEIAPARNRGKLGLMYQLAVTVGAASATIVSYFIAKNITDIAINWRWMFASEILPIILFIFLLLGVPQSPRWLAGRNRDSEALAILSRVNGTEEAKKDMGEIKDSLKTESGSLSELIKPGIRMALLIGVLLAIFNNWTGWSGVAYYLPTIFQMGGYGNASDAILVSIIPMIANILLTLVAIWLIDRTGRRPIWLFTSAAMVIALIVMGTAFQMNLKGPIIIVVTLMILAPHAIGLGGLPWLMMSELYPTKIRARAVSITTTFLWIAGFTGPFAFPKLVEVSKSLIGSPAGIFWMYAVISVFAFIFGLKLLPETKGRSLEEIARSWTKRPKVEEAKETEVEVV